MKKLFTSCTCAVAASFLMFTASALDYEVGDLFQTDDHAQTGLSLWFEVTGTNPATASVTTGLYENSYTGNIVIPSVVTGKGVEYTVTGLGNGAFDGCVGLESLVLPETLEFIGEWSVANTGIKTITIPASVIDIYPHAPFAENSYLTEIIVDPANPNYASYNGILYDKSLETLIQCPGGIESVSFPSTLKTIVMSGFTGCNKINKLVVPAGVETLENGSFQYCESLLEAELPGTISRLPSWCFGRCEKLEKVTLNEGIKVIGFCAFEICTSLKAIRVPDSVEIIDEYAFKDCLAMTEAIIGSGTESIGDGAFRDCTSLTKVICLASTPPETEFAFYGSSMESIPLYVPIGSADLYREAVEWSQFASIEEIDPEQYTSVAETAVSSLSVNAANGRIHVSAPDNSVITLFNADGRKIASSAKTLDVNAGHGIFIVRSGKETVKVVL